LEIGTAFIINFVSGAIRAFLKKFCSHWSRIAENIISWKWIQHFVKCINTLPVQEKFWEKSAERKSKAFL